MTAMPLEKAEIEVIESDARVQELSAGALELLDQARSIEITDAASDAAACEFILQVKTARKRWDELRHWFTDPLEKQKKAIIARFKNDDEPLAEAESIVSRKHLEWDRAQREAARKEQERLQKLAERRAEREAKKAEEKGVEPPPVVIPMPTIAEPPKTVRTAAGSLTTRVVWKFEVIDFAALPDEYKVPDAAKLGRVVNAGARNIPGVRIFQTETLGGRS